MATAHFDMYLPPHATERIDAAARLVCLTRLQFLRAAILSVAEEVARLDQEITGIQDAPCPFCGRREA